jgi:hypothetical protein
VLILGQFFHVYVCKTRFMPIWEHGLLDNTLMNYGCVTRWTELERNYMEGYGFV